MNYLDAEMAIALAARENGMSTEEFKAEIDLAIDEAMQCCNPAAKELWALIPRAGEKPTAVEFIAYMRNIVHKKEHGSQSGLASNQSIFSC